MVAIRGLIRLPSLQRFEDAVAIVGLDDVSMIDAPSVRVAETRVEPIRGLCDRIPFCLTANETLLTSDSYVLAAEIRRSGKEGLAKGDFLTTAAFPWVKGDDDKVIDVEQI